MSYGASRKGGQGGLVPFGSNRTVAAYEQEAMDQAKAAGIAYEVREAKCRQGLDPTRECYQWILIISITCDESTIYFAVCKHRA